MNTTQTKPQFLTEALIEVLNNQWKVDAIESIRTVYTQLRLKQVESTSKFGPILLMTVGSSLRE